MKATLATKDTDYQRIGVKKNQIEVWEDGRRSIAKKGYWEWWYFDTILDDKTKVVIQFFAKSGADLFSNKDHPRFTIRVTTPDGKEYTDKRKFSVSDASWSQTSCDVTYGKNYFKGNLKEYEIYVEEKNGLGADLYLKSLSKPYRPGTGYFEFGSPDKFYTWFCVVPRGEVQGSITIKGKKYQVHGYGYHDHQWGNVNFQKEWNHWVWARQSFEDASILVFDMVSNENTSYTRFPICFIQDKEGNLLFENLENVQCDVQSEYYDDISEKYYPSGIHYVMKNDGKELVYDLQYQEIIECNGKNKLSPFVNCLAKMLKFDPAYTRYSAKGHMTLKNKDSLLDREGNLIYEFMYPGKSFKGHM